MPELTTEVLAKQKRMYFDISGGIMPQEQNNLNYWLNFGEKPTLIKEDQHWVSMS